MVDLDSGCGGPFPETTGEFFGDLQVGPSACECECGEATPVCSDQMNVIGYSGINCVTGEGQHDITENECYNTFSASHGLSLAPADTQCQGGTVTPSFPAPQWGVSLAACGGFTEGPATCGPDEICVPKPTGDLQTELCYVQEGNRSCPADFPTKFLMYMEFEDTRVCPPDCDCNGSGSYCHVEVVGFANPNCASPQGSIDVDSGGEECVAANSSVVESIRPGNVSPAANGTCDPAPTNMGGDVAEVGATTVCCA
jgi:hypothetical protein